MKKQAFTLFEVLLALGIFAIAVLGMVGALNGVLNAAREARIEQRVRTEVENRLAAWEDGKLEVTDRVTRQTSPPLTLTESIRREAVVNDRREVLDGFWRIKVVATWTTDGEARSEESSIVRYQP